MKLIKEHHYCIILLGDVSTMQHCFHLCNLQVHSDPLLLSSVVMSFL